MNELESKIYTPNKALEHPFILMSDLFKDLAKGRELSWRLFVRDFKVQYTQTILGYLWAFIPALFAALTFLFLQSQGIMQVEGLGVPYFVFTMTGIMLWQTFVEALQSPLSSLNASKSMLSKINFPRESILIAGLYMVLTSALIRLAMVVVVMFAYGVTPGGSLVFLPFFIFGLVICGFSIGMITIPVGGLYGDISRVIPIVSQFWMLLTPVVYPARTSGWLGWISSWNPVAPLIGNARACLTNSPLEFVWHSVLVVIFSLVLALAGMVCFRLIIPHLIERMGG